MSIISMITGNDTPVGEQWVDDRMEEAQQLGAQAVQQVKAWSMDDPDTWTDDALRWVGGAIKGTGNWWQENTAEQEGLHDNFLRSVGWVGGKAMKVLDAGSYYGGEIGGKVAEFIGVDARIGGFAGNVIGDVALGGAFTKVGQSAKTYNRIKKLRGLGVSDLQIQDLFSRKHAFAYGELADAPSDVRLALTAKKPEAGKKLLRNLTALDDQGNYVNPVARLPGAEGKGTRIGGDNKWSKADVASGSKFKSEAEFVADRQAFTTAKKIQSSKETPWAHHHIVDHDIAGPAFNRVDAKEIDEILKKKGIRLGDDERNIIAAAHYKDSRKAWQEEILKQRPDLDERTLDDLTKNVIIDEFGEIDPPNIQGRYTYGAGPEQYPGQLYVNRWRTQGIDRVAMKIDPQTMIMGRDHTGIIHEAYKMLPSNKRLREAFKSGEYWHWPPQKAADAIAEAAIDQKNISLNVAKWRLNLIKEKMGLGTANGLNFTPNSNYRKLRVGSVRPADYIKQWIKEQPADAVNLGWMKKPPTIFELKSKHGKVTKELKSVFTYKD